MVIPLSFFNRDTVQVAKDLLGTYLVRRWRGRTFRYQITEVEAYDGFFDRASHASRGKTARNAPMFGHAGYWYVYFTYGMHWMLNIVTREHGYPAAILIRGIAIFHDVGNHEINTKLNGPAKLTKHLHIDKKLNTKQATKESGLWIEYGKPVAQNKIKSSARIGVSFAGPRWAKRRWRFYLDAD